MSLFPIEREGNMNEKETEKEDKKQVFKKACLKIWISLAKNIKA